MSVAFDDPNLVSSAGLVPVLALASRCGLLEAAGAVLTVPSPNAAIKVTAVVAGMVAGADSIDDLGRLRHGGMGRGVHRDPGAVDAGPRSSARSRSAMSNSSTRSRPSWW